MMTDYTPETENVRLGYAYRGNLPEGARHHPGLLAEFDRWLSNHDAEVRAGVLTDLKMMNGSEDDVKAYEESQARVDAALAAFRNLPLDMWEVRMRAALLAAANVADGA